MNLVSILILFPLVAALIVFIVRQEKIRDGLVRVSALITAILTIITVCYYFKKGVGLSFGNEAVIDSLMAVLELVLAGYLIFTGIKNKKYMVCVFVIIQTPLLLWFEFTQKTGIEVGKAIVFDKLAAIMLLIIGIVGSLICFYSVGYMRWYHIHHEEYPVRKNFFYSVMFLFIAAMFGLVLSNSLTWLYFCWEITSFSSFLLIGYTKTEEAKNNAFRALAMNLGGGLAFAIAIVFIGMNYHTLELSGFISLEPDAVAMIPVFLISMAALTKSAQMPFQSWLLGAMVAPTPSSALLHSATMVKAGVYLLIRIAPLLGPTSVGRMVTIVGAVTFMMCSLMAISQSDAKKILAYSTIANLGLIVICASIGTQESLWAAILLVIFHAISKSLLFLTVGSTEHQIGSRNVEDMDILLHVSRKLSLCMLIGIAGMFLAPFGMLISKWVAMKAFIDSNNILVIIILAFGSAATLFYWTKWMGKLVSNANAKNIEKHKLHLEEEFAILVLTGLVVISCLGFPIISKYALIPYLTDVFGVTAAEPIGSSDMNIMLIMLSMLIVLPISFIPVLKNDKRRIIPTYMAGENVGDNERFYSMGNTIQKVTLRNWYMEDYFGNKKVTVWSNLVIIIIISVFVMFMIWGVVS
ncbi:MAG: proton-conducting transporter membrane subunit [Lachnospiraceae bacterium]|nr:proton-conducting transporter membrane subunit [Lachnospiraceae bacterium]